MKHMRFWLFAIIVSGLLNYAIHIISGEEGGEPAQERTTEQNSQDDQQQVAQEALEQQRAHEQQLSLSSGQGAIVSSRTSDATVKIGDYTSGQLDAQLDFLKKLSVSTASDWMEGIYKTISDLRTISSGRDTQAASIAQEYIAKFLQVLVNDIPLQFAKLERINELNSGLKAINEAMAGSSISQEQIDQLQNLASTWQSLPYNIIQELSFAVPQDLSSLTPEEKSNWADGFISEFINQTGLRGKIASTSAFLTPGSLEHGIFVSLRDKNLNKSLFSILGFGNGIATPQEVKEKIEELNDQASPEAMEFFTQLGRYLSDPMINLMYTTYLVNKSGFPQIVENMGKQLDENQSIVDQMSANKAQIQLQIGEALFASKAQLPPELQMIKESASPESLEDVIDEDVPNIEQQSSSTLKKEEESFTQAVEENQIPQEIIATQDELKGEGQSLLKYITQEFENSLNLMKSAENLLKDENPEIVAIARDRLLGIRDELNAQIEKLDFIQQYIAWSILKSSTPAERAYTEWTITPLMVSFLNIIGDIIASHQTAFNEQVGPNREVGLMMQLRDNGALAELLETTYGIRDQNLRENLASLLSTSYERRLALIQQDPLQAILGVSADAPQEEIADKIMAFESNNPLSMILIANLQKLADPFGLSLVRLYRLKSKYQDPATFQETVDALAKPFNGPIEIAPNNTMTLEAIIERATEARNNIQTALEGLTTAPSPKQEKSVPQGVLAVASTLSAADLASQTVAENKEITNEIIKVVQDLSEAAASDRAQFLDQFTGLFENTSQAVQNAQTGQQQKALRELNIAAQAGVNIGEAVQAQNDLSNIINNRDSTPDDIMAADQAADNAVNSLVTSKVAVATSPDLAGLDQPITQAKNDLEKQQVASEQTAIDMQPETNIPSLEELRKKLRQAHIDVSSWKRFWRFTYWIIDSVNYFSSDKQKSGLGTTLDNLTSIIENKTVLEEKLDPEFMTAVETDVTALSQFMQQHEESFKTSALPAKLQALQNALQHNSAIPEPKA